MKTLRIEENQPALHVLGEFSAHSAFRSEAVLDIADTVKQAPGISQS